MRQETDRIAEQLAKEIPGCDERHLRGLARGRSGRFHGRWLNVLPDEEDTRDYRYSAGLGRIRPVLPVPSILTPAPTESRAARIFRRKLIRDQGAEGSCTGQALAAVIDIQNLWRRFDRPTDSLDALQQRTEFAEWADRRASARMLYEMARALDEEPEHRMPGSTLRNALKAFRLNGCCLDKSAPYEPYEPGWHLGIEQAKEARSTNLSAYFRIGQNINDYHAALNEVGAIYVSAMIHEGWYQVGDREPPAASGGTPLDIPTPGANEKLRGAHAFALVGYDDEGFFVLNSWGASWATSIDERTGERFGTPGVARWSYDDWRDHVLDAWVFRLGVPTERAFRARGGFGIDIDAVSGKRRSRTPRVTINGHYLHLKDGRYVTTGRYPNTRETLEDTHALLRERLRSKASGPSYGDVLLFFMNGFSSLDIDAPLVEAWVHRCKEREIYPVFVFWNYAERARLVNLLEADFETYRSRYSGSGAALARKLEQGMADYGQLFWGHRGEQCEAMCGAPGDPLQDIMRLPLFAALIPFLTLVKSGRCRCHLAAHGDGVFLLEHFAERCARLPEFAVDNESRHHCSSATLFAPLCDMEYTESLASLLPQGSKQQVDVVTLSETDEARDQMGPYPGTLPRLVQNSRFPARASSPKDERVLGLYENAKAKKRSPVYDHWTCPEHGTREQRSHFGMLSNPSLVDAFMERIISSAG